MRTLTRSPRAPQAGGEALNLERFPELQRLGVHFRTSELSMVAGPPGAGKSTVVMTIALRSQEPCLYICADTSEHTIRTRLAAMVTGETQEALEPRLNTDDTFATQVHEPSSHIKWAFPAQPTIKSIETEVAAYLEVMGRTPKAIIIDNLIDIHSDTGGEEWSALRHSMAELKHLARRTTSAVIVLHHTSEGHSYDHAPPMRAVQGKVSQLPALLLTVGLDLQTMYVAAVKSRDGQGDPNARHYVALDCDLSRMRVGAA